MKQRTRKLRAVADPLGAVRVERLTCAALLSSVLSVSTAVAAQQQPPSDDELRSMYCVEVLRAEIK